MLEISGSRHAEPSPGKEFRAVSQAWLDTRHGRLGLGLVERRFVERSRDESIRNESATAR
jgi:hypothetical protein